MRYLIVYDIEPDRIRTKISNTLECYGKRIQKSVFECDLESGALDKMTRLLEHELDSPRNGNIRVYRVCSNCIEASFSMGGLGPQDDAGDCIIFD